MTARPLATGTARRFAQDENGTTLVELALTIALFLLIFFGILDFGRLAYNYVAAEKALQIAARLAAVRPAICNNVPVTNQRGANTEPRFGAKCNSAENVCLALETPISCTAGDADLDADSALAAAEIWDRIDGLMPVGASEENLRFSYSYDDELGFLGGPFVPVVTVELVDLDFQFLGVLGGLAQLAGATSAGGVDDLETNGVPFGLSVSLPGEDLAVGMNG